MWRPGSVHVGGSLLDQMEPEYSGEVLCYPVGCCGEPATGHTLAQVSPPPGGSTHTFQQIYLPEQSECHLAHLLQRGLNLRL